MLLNFIGKKEINLSLLNFFHLINSVLPANSLTLFILLCLGANLYGDRCPFSTSVVPENNFISVFSRSVYRFFRDQCYIYARIPNTDSKPS